MDTVNNITAQDTLIQHTKGTIFDKSFEVRKSNGALFDLTTYSGIFKITSTLGGASAYSISTSTANLTFLRNNFRIIDTININAGNYFFELRITDGTNTYVIWHGKFNVEY